MALTDSVPPPPGSPRPAAEARPAGRSGPDRVLLLALVLAAAAMAGLFTAAAAASRSFGAVSDLAHLGGDVRAAVSEAHLWFEEALAGDASIDMDRDVLGRIDDSAARVQQVLDRVAVGEDQVKLGDETLADVRALSESIARWRGLAVTRWSARGAGSGAGLGAGSGAGSVLDQQFDGEFDRILDGCKLISRELGADVDRSWSRTLWTGASIVALLIVGVVAMIVILSRQRRAIAEQNAELEGRVARRTARLAESEARARAVLEAALHGFITIDENGTVDSVNAAAATLFGWESAEIVGKNVRMLVPSPHREQHDEYLARYLRTGEARIVGIGREVEGVRKDGTRFPMHLSISDLCVGQRRLFIGMVLDLTERKRVESVLQNARESAEAAARAKSEFLANMSHEIRTPLNAVIGMTGLLGATELDAEQRDYVDTIRQSGDALLSVINDILDFSKMESGKFTLEESPFSVCSVVEDALDLVAASAAAKDVDVCYLVEPGVPATLTGDASRLRQILLNLLSNAVKFTERGSVSVWVHGRAPSEAGPCELEFSVRDSGIGIPADRIDRLFQTFSQVDASTTRRYGGTGLGLAICKTLVELMGGRIWVESEPGKGSNFRFTVVLRAAAASAVAGPAPDVGGARALIVDDNATNRRILELQTASWSMTSMSAASGEDALALVAAGERFDVAILDVQMPGMDGITLARRVRALPGGAAIRIVVLTSLGHRKDVAEFDAFLTKPVKASALQLVLASVLRRDRPAAPTAGPVVRDPRPALWPNLRVLLVEDNPVNQKVASRMLAEMGCRPDIAGNGREAVDQLARKSYDVIFMDVQMPEMDGLEATREIRRRSPADRGPRIVAMTASALHGDREACLAAGMDAYLTKPVRREQLQRALAEMAELVASRSANAAPAAIDRGAIQSLFALGEDDGMVAEIVGIYLTDAPARLDAIRRGLAGADAAAVAAAAHSLKGSSAYVGAHEVSTAAGEIERSARSGDLATSGAQTSQLAQAMDRARLELEPLARRAGDAAQAGGPETGQDGG